MITLLVTPDELAGQEVGVEGEAYRHLFRARRVGVGERVRVVDGQGRARWAEVGRVDRRRGTLLLAEPAPSHEASTSVHLLVPLPRKERAAWLVEKVTELGASTIRFLQSSRAPRRLEPGTLERLRRVAASALEQSHRSRLPEITGAHPWEEIPQLLSGCAQRWFLDTEAGTAGIEIEGSHERSVALLVGPEGGWSDEERARLRELGGRALFLGKRTLRIETAATLAVGLLLLPRNSDPVAASKQL